MNRIRWALVSVSDKTGLVELGQALQSLGISILSTGGTADALRDGRVQVVDVSDYTGFPEMMGGRLKTLHPLVHGGILGRRGTDDNVMIEHKIMQIDLVVVNLYPFAQVTAKPDCSLETAIENIDIGGPTMIRSAAKNHQSVTVVTNPNDYGMLIEVLRDNDGVVPLPVRQLMAVKAFEATADYDAGINRYLAAHLPT